MKIKKNLVLREVAGTWVVLPTNSNVLDFDGMITLNETGIVLWKLLEKGSSYEEMTSALLEEYDASREQVLADVHEFVEKLKSAGCVE